MSDCFLTPWTVAQEAPLSMGFVRHGYWSRLPFPSPGDLPSPGIEHMSPALAGGFFFFFFWQVNSLPLSHLGSPMLTILHSHINLLRNKV